MERLVHIGVVLFGGVLVFTALVYVVIDMFGRVDYLKEHIPWLARFLERKDTMGALVLVAVLLFIGNLYEIMNHEIPEISGPTIRIVPPVPPAVIVPQVPQPKKKQQLPPNSGRNQSAPPVLTGIRIASQERIPSDDPKLSYGLEVVIQTDADIAPVALALICDGNIGKGDAGFANGGAFIQTKEGLAAGHSNVFIAEWSWPAWTPQSPVVFHIFSETPLRATEIRRINYAWP